MDHAIYTAMGAANAALDRQAITSNNLANASTTGFRAQLSATRAIPVDGPTIPTRTLVAESTPYNDDTMGAIVQTGNPLDVALPQNGWLAVQRPDGSEGYTRNGNIDVDSEGGLRVRGLPLMGDGGPLTVPPDATISIEPDGAVTAMDSNSTMPVQVGQLKMVQAQMRDLRNGDDGLFSVADPAANPVLGRDPSLRLTPGAIENSNVSPVKSMVDMIANARSFDLHMKVITTVDDNEKNANQLLTLS